MKNQILKQFRSLIVIAVLFSLISGPENLYAQKRPIKNIVIVHGAFADGSGWQGVFSILNKKGYHVTIVQNPLTSLKDDVDATNRVLDKQDGLTILVGHSWGGTVITQAGNHPKVAALVYVAAFQPNAGENTLKWAASLPPAPENGIGAPDDKGFIYFDQSKFHAGFAADVSKDEAEFMYASQQPIYGESFITPVTAAAWHNKPAYGIVATEDKAIVPAIQWNMYKRSNTKVTEVKGSHVLFMTHPDQVTQVIIDAANGK